MDYKAEIASATEVAKNAANTHIKEVVTSFLNDCIKDSRINKGTMMELFNVVEGFSAEPKFSVEDKWEEMTPEQAATLGFVWGNDTNNLAAIVDWAGDMKPLNTKVIEKSITLHPYDSVYDDLEEWFEEHPEATEEEEEAARDAIIKNRIMGIYKHPVRVVSYEVCEDFVDFLDYKVEVLDVAC